MPVVNIINGKSFSQVSENQRTVFFDLEMTGHVLSVNDEKNSHNLKEKGTGKCDVSSSCLIILLVK